MRTLILLELLLVAGSLIILHPSATGEIGGAETLGGLVLLTLTGTEAVFGLSLLIQTRITANQS